MSANSFLSVGLETARGTAAATAADYVPIPITTPELVPMLPFLKDSSFRGSPVENYDQIPGTWHSEVSGKGYVYADSIPILLIGAIGPDVPSGTYIHTISLENDITTGSQPQSLTWAYNDGANPWQVAGGQVADIEFSGGVDKALEWSGKMVGNIWTNTAIALTVSTVPFIPSWNTVISVDSAQLTYISDWTCKIDRKSAPIFTAGAQGPHVNFAGPIEVSGTFTYVVDSDADPFAVGGTAYALYRSATAIPLTLTSTSPVDSSSVEFQMSNVQFQDVKHSTGKAYTEGTVNYTANANATDAITGYSPIVAIVNNAVAAYTAS